jgi:hypothetical protein
MFPSDKYVVSHGFKPHLHVSVRAFVEKLMQFVYAASSIFL